MLITRRNALLGLAAATSGLVPHTASSQAAWPTGKTITYVVPYPAGGTTDVLARLIVPKLAAALGATVIVENKPGATGAISGGMVANAPPDGFTLLGTSIGPMAILPSLSTKLPYDPIASFEPVVMVGTVPSVLVVGGTSPFKSVAELVAAATAKPGTLTFASGGNGTILHMSGELLKLSSGIDMTHIPYRGDTPAIQDVIGGHAGMMFAPVTPILSHVQTGQLRALAVAASQRIPELPNVPTMAEAGIANAEAEQWQAIFAPKGTPRPIIDRMNAEIRKALAEPEVAGKLSAAGVTVRAGSPEDLRAFHQADIAKWAKVIRTANIKID
ncbi:MAG: tripartite tricarboxylate transporter substrate binding protein [Acetobacteraceae bacterium]|jgi:tripartite-type tricarboxylate transporter receptor subunit TctC|nr:tripartite tricarboxylate transporter substrate binding protein [Acetobacteraceae bacterium]